RRHHARVCLRSRLPRPGIHVRPLTNSVRSVPQAFEVPAAGPAVLVQVQDGPASRLHPPVPAVPAVLPPPSLDQPPPDDVTNLASAIPASVVTAYVAAPPLPPSGTPTSAATSPPSVSTAMPTAGTSAAPTHGSAWGPSHSTVHPAPATNRSPRSRTPPDNAVR